jgi:site-specific DNA recombinase
MQGDRTAPPLAILYAAKSTTDEHGSIPDQIDRCREYAAAQGWEVNEPPERDEAASGYTGSRGPGLVHAKARAAALAQEANDPREPSAREVVLLVFATDRLARGDGRTAAHLVEHVLDGLKAGYRIESVTENLGGEMALVFASLYGERAHADSKAKSEHTKRGIQKMVREGRWHGPAPYGYRAEGRHEERHLVVDEPAAAIVRRVFDQYVTTGAGTGLIAFDLDADGVPPPRAKRWDRSTVANLLDQPAYIGRVKVNGETYPGQHEAIVDEGVWLRAQAQRQARKPGTTHAGRPPLGTHLLTGGLLRCGECGGAMSPRSPRGRQARYECATRNRSGGSTLCLMKGVLRKDVDEPLLAYLEGVVFDLDATREVIAEEHARRSSENATLIAQAERAVTEADVALTRIRADYVAGAITAKQWQGFEAELTETRDAATRELEQLTANRPPEVLCLVDDEVTARLAALREAVAGEVTGAEGLAAVRQALRRCFQFITLWQADEDGLLLVPTVLAWDELGTGWLDLRNGQAVSFPRPERIAVPGQQGEAAPWCSPSLMPGQQGDGAPSRCPAALSGCAPASSSSSAATRCAAPRSTTSSVS